MEDIRCLKSVAIDLEESHWFRSESELQNEGKGGFLRGKITIKGLDTLKEEAKKIVLSLVSNHSSELHCNLLRIGLNSFNKTKQKSDGLMPPAAYSIVLIRDTSNCFKIDPLNHDYLPSGLNEVGFWDDTSNTLNLGEKSSQNNILPKESGLCINIVKPLSKQDLKIDSSKKYCHIRQVLKQIKEDETRKELAGNLRFPTQVLKDKELERLMADFVKNELNEDCSNSKRKKQGSKSLETILAEGEMHKAKLKVTVYIGPKDTENDNYDSSKIIEIENTSEWICASNRYGFKIDPVTTKAVILDHSSIMDLTIFLEPCKLTSKIAIEAQFLCGQKKNGDGSRTEIKDDEIEILNINGKPVYRDKLGSVVLQIFLKTNCGDGTSDTNLNRVKNGIMKDGTKIEFGLYLRLRVLDESGYIGAEDTIELSCLPHDCLYDAQLAREDKKCQDIINVDVIKRWSQDGTLQYLPCNTCQFWGMQSRVQYLQKSKSNSLLSKDAPQISMDLQMGQRNARSMVNLEKLL